MTKLVVLAITFAAGVAGAAPVDAATGAPGSAPAVANGLSLNAAGEVIYDSNQLRIPSSGTLGTSQRKKDDFRYSPSLNAQYVRAVGRTTLIVNGLVGRDFYQNNKYLDRNRFSGGGSLSYRTASCSATGNGSYSERQNGIRGFGNSVQALPDPSNPPPDDVGRLIDNRQISTTYGVNGSCGSPSGRLTFGGGAQHSELSNGAISRQFADSNSDVYSAFAGLGVFRPGQLQVNGSYSIIGYPNRLTTPGVTPLPLGLNTGVKTYRVGVSFTRPIGTKLSGTIGGSYLTARPDGPQAPYSSPAYDISLSYTPGNRLSFVLLGSRNILASSTAGALFRVVDQIELTGSYQIGEAISARANAGLIRNDYHQSFATTGEPARRSEASKIFGVGVTYAPRPLYDVGVFVSETFRTANPSIFNYNSTKASITLAIHI